MDYDALSAPTRPKFRSSQWRKWSTTSWHNGIVHFVTQEQTDSTRFLIIKGENNDNIRLCLAKWMCGRMVVQDMSYTFGFSGNHVKNGRYRVLSGRRRADALCASFNSWAICEVSLSSLAMGNTRLRLGRSFSSTDESLGVPNEWSLTRTRASSFLPLASHLRPLLGEAFRPSSPPTSAP